MQDDVVVGIVEGIFAGPRLRAQAGEQGAVKWEGRFEGWVVSSYELVDAVLREHRVFSSDERAAGPPAAHHESPVLRSLLAMDPPEHHRLRRIVSQGFTPRAIDRAQQRIAAKAEELITHLGSAPEIVDGFASPLTTAMLAEFLGLPDDRRDDFVRWTHFIAGFIGPDATDPKVRAEFESVIDELEHFLRDAANHPVVAADTVLAALLAAGPDGEQLTERELLDFLILLIVNGHETTTRLIYHTVLCMERYPDQHGELRAGATSVDAVVDEVARFLPPTSGTDRFTTTSTTLGGQAIDAGCRVVAMISAANRDPTVFPDPHRFAPNRTPNPHLSFGRGVHACLGAHLARREAKIAVRCLLEHVPGRWRVPASELVATTTPVGTDIRRLVLTGA